MTTVFLLGLCFAVALAIPTPNEHNHQDSRRRLKKLSLELAADDGGDVRRDLTSQGSSRKHVGPKHDLENTLNNLITRYQHDYDKGHYYKSQQGLSGYQHHTADRNYYDYPHGYNYNNDKNYNYHPYGYNYNNDKNYNYHPYGYHYNTDKNYYDNTYGYHHNTDKKYYDNTYGYHHNTDKNYYDYPHGYHYNNDRNYHDYPHGYQYNTDKNYHDNTYGYHHNTDKNYYDNTYGYHHNTDKNYPYNTYGYQHTYDRNYQYYPYNHQQSLYTSQTGNDKGYNKGSYHGLHNYLGNYGTHHGLYNYADKGTHHGQTTNLDTYTPTYHGLGTNLNHGITSSLHSDADRASHHGQDNDRSQSNDLESLQNLDNQNRLEQSISQQQDQDDDKTNKELLRVAQQGASELRNLADELHEVIPGNDNKHGSVQVRYHAAQSVERNKDGSVNLGMLSFKYVPPKYQKPSSLGLLGNNNVSLKDALLALSLQKQDSKSLTALASNPKYLILLRQNPQQQQQQQQLEESDD